MRQFVFMIIALVVACEGKKLEVRKEATDFGGDELAIALKVYSQQSNSPEAYKQFSERVEALKSQLNLKTSAEAELRLALLAFQHLKCKP